MTRLVAPTLSILPALFAAACTCGAQPDIETLVVDLWGNPVDGVTVTLQGSDATVTTDGKGSAHLPMAPKITVDVARDGYIPREILIEPAKTDMPHQETIQLIPEPEQQGFSAVGIDSYLLLKGEPVVRVGNELRTWHGIRSTGDVEVDGDPLRVIFHTDMRRDEVARLDIELHKLEFVEGTEVHTVDGSEEVDVNLWISAGKVKYEKVPLGSDDNYAFRVEDLEPGSYAFVTEHLLDAKDEASFDALAKEVRKVHAFNVE